MNEYVYMITDGSYIKIGKANDIDRRIRELQTGNPKKLEILHVFECDEGEANTLEKQIHSDFACLRVHGEWFSMRILDFLNPKKGILSMIDAKGRIKISIIVKLEELQKEILSGGFDKIKEFNELKLELDKIA
tara:strand:- start:6437 stop:6835 length:399 start_codon:yes stop_codon:yes gene_type:complete